MGTLHPPVATPKLTTTTDSILEPGKEIVELPQVEEPFRHEPVPPRTRGQTNNRMIVALDALWSPQRPINSDCKGEPKYWISKCKRVF